MSVCRSNFRSRKMKNGRLLTSQQQGNKGNRAWQENGEGKGPAKGDKLRKRSEQEIETECNRVRIDRFGHTLFHVRDGDVARCNSIDSMSLDSISKILIRAMKDSGRGLLDGSWLSRWNMFVRVDGIAVQDFFRSLHWHCWHAWNLLGWPRALRLGHYIIVIWRDGFDSSAAGSEEEDPLQPLLLKVATAFKCVVCFASPVTDLLIACLIDWLVGWLVADRLTEKFNYSGIMIAQFKISAQIDYHAHARARAHTHTHKPACTGLQQQWRFNKKATQTLQG